MNDMALWFAWGFNGGFLIGLVFALIYLWRGKQKHTKQHTDIFYQ